MTSYGGDNRSPSRALSTWGRSPRNGASESPPGESCAAGSPMGRDRTQPAAHAIMRPVAPYLRGSTRPLAEEYDVALLDLDGVVYVGPDAVPGAPEALAAA